MTIAILNTAWQTLVKQTGIVQEHASELFQELITRYSEPHRHYHNLEHLAQVLQIIDDLSEQAHRPNDLRLAAWFHDAVYDPQVDDNEIQSAAFAKRALQTLNLDMETINSVQRLILSTQNHTPQTGDFDAQILLDADLSILSASPDEYDRYAQAIRQEYVWVPEEIYRHERIRILQTFLNRPRLYFTQKLYARLEAQARHNLKNEIQRLKG